MPAQAAAPVRQAQTFRTIYVLIGGSGMKTGLRLRKKCLETWGIAQLPFQRYLWLDTDRNDVDTQTFGDEPVIERRLKFRDMDLVDLTLPLARVQQFLNNPHDYPWLWGWLDPQTLRDLGANAQAEFGAAQIRALGRLAFTNSFTKFSGQFDRHMRALRDPKVTAESQRYGFSLDPDAIEVVIVCSLAGGTGSGCFLEAARWMRQLSGDHVNFTAHLFLPSIFKGRFADKEQAWLDVRANAHAALQELNDLACMSRPGARPSPLWIGEHRYDQPMGLPFHEVYLIDARNDAGLNLEEPADDDAFEMLADALFFDFDPSAFGTTKRTNRCNIRPHLGTSTQVSVPVPDGNTYPEPRYVFQFPNSFGALGIARVPFERDRLRRAAGAWLARRMLTALVESSNRLDAQQIAVLLEERGSEVRVDSGAVIADLLDDGRGSSFPDAGAAEMTRQLDDLRKRVDANFRLDGRAPDEKIRTLHNAPEFGRKLREDALGLLQKGRAEVQRNLRSAAADPDVGPHLNAIRAKQRTTRDKFRQKIEGFALQLVCNLQHYGYDVACAALQALVVQLRRNAEQAIPAPVWPDFPELEVDPGQAIQDAAEKLSQAQSLVLPLYGRIAQRICAERSRNELDEASHRCVQQAREFLNAAERAYRGWIEQSYRAAAVENSRELLRGLASFVDSQSEIRGADGRVSDVRATGLLPRLRELSAAAQTSMEHFQSLERSYHRTRRSSRNGEDLGGGLVLGTQVERILMSDDEATARPLLARLTETWEQFLTAHHQLLREGDTNVLESGVRVLVERAVGRSADAEPWREFEGLLEGWTISILRQKGFLAETDATRLMSDPAQAQAQLGHITNSAQPWLCFNQARAADIKSLQREHTLGTQVPDGTTISGWVREHAKWTPVGSSGGSLVALVEKMAFPLFVVESLGELRQAYGHLVSRRPTDIPRRHTVLDPLDLPMLTPPEDDQQAIRWFGIDRLALEAVMLGLFRPASDRREERCVEYSYEDANMVMQHLRFPRSLRAIAAHLRANEVLHRQVEAEVQNRYRAVFAGTQSAVAAVLLAHHYSNAVFPPAAQAAQQQERYLEHELSRSVLTFWREASIRRLNINDATLRMEMEAGAALAASARVPSPVQSPMARQPLVYLMIPEVHDTRDWSA
jgi:hypothetical protein